MGIFNVAVARHADVHAGGCFGFALVDTLCGEVI